MNTGKRLLLAAMLAAGPFTISAASAQNQHTYPNNTMQQRDRATTDRNRTDQRSMDNRTMGERDMRHRDMRHYGWRRGHHNGWRHCMMRWHGHHRVRICR
jgi:Ni/Co efflux regulator RcnB